MVIVEVHDVGGPQLVLAQDAFQASPICVVPAAFGRVGVLRTHGLEGSARG